MSTDVFISYARKDKPIADGICASLEAAKIGCWIAPRNLARQRNARKATDRALAHSRVLVLVFSADADASPEITQELYLAAQVNAVLIPVKIDDTVPVLEKQYYLGRPQWHATQNPPTAEQLQRLVERVRTVLAVSVAKPKSTGRAWLYLIPSVLILLGLLAVLVSVVASEQVGSLRLPTPVSIAVAASVTPSPTQMPSPTLTPAPTLTPLPTRMIVSTQAPFAEHFEDPQFDGSLPPSLSDVCAVEKMAQLAGSLQIFQSTQRNECRIDVGRMLQTAEFKFVQARMRAVGPSSMPDGLGGIGLRLSNGFAGGSFITATCTSSLALSYCSLVLTEPVTARDPQVTNLYDSRRVTHQPDAWSTVRIELVNPETLEWAFDIDDVKLDSYTVPPERGLRYQSADFFLFRAPSGAAPILYVDDIAVSMR